MRNEVLTERLMGLLQRLSPPRSMLKNKDAQQAEVDHMLTVVLSAAPSSGYEEWWQRFEADLLESHQTRAWPTIFEITETCKRLRRDDSGAVAGTRGDAEAEIVQIRDWLGRGHFRASSTFRHPEATARLIAEGVFENEREARFRGFPLSPEMNARAIGKSTGGWRRTGQQPMSRAEWDHHIRVLANLRRKPEREVIEEERAALSAAELPTFLGAAE